MLIQPHSIPALPVLDWRGFGKGEAGDVLSVADGSLHVFTSSGRAAIMLGLESLGVGKGDRVMVPTYHCPTMVAPIIAVGAEPVFYPINQTGEAQLESAWPIVEKIKAVIVPHFFGIPQDMARIRALCDMHGAALIEDCAHCFFGHGGTRVVGHWGDIAIASLTKFFPVPSGGLLAFPTGMQRPPDLNPPGLVNELKAVIDILETAAGAGRLMGLGSLLRGLFLLKRNLRRDGSKGGGAAAPLMSDVIVPDALRFDVTLAHRASERICRWLPSITDRNRLANCRRDNYHKLARALSGHKAFVPLFPVLPTGAVPYVFPLLVKQPDDKYRKLKGLGLPVFRWNWLWPGTPVLSGDSGQLWSSEVFQLPCHQDLTDAELDCICSTVIRVCSGPVA